MKVPLLRGVHRDGESRQMTQEECVDRRHRAYIHLGKGEHQRAIQGSRIARMMCVYGGSGPPAGTIL